MIQIMICDEDASYAQKISQCIEKWFCKWNLEVKTNISYSADTLWYEIMEGKQSEYHLSDVYLVNVEKAEAKKLDGMELARRISTEYPHVLLILMSSNLEIAIQGYTVGAFRFVTKDKMNILLPVALKDAAKKIISQEENYFLTEKKNRIQKIPLKDVLYISREGKYSVFQMCNGENIRVRITLKAAYEKLEDKRFSMVERGYICNLERIDHMEGNMVIMKDKMKFFVPKGKIAFFHDLLKTAWMNC